MTNQQLKAHCEDVIANPQEHSEIVLAMAATLLQCLDVTPCAWAHRLVNKRNGVKHPWVYGIAEAAASEGDIFRVEILRLYTAPPAPELKLTLEQKKAIAHSAHFRCEQIRGSFYNAAEFAIEDALRLNGVKS